MFYFIFLTWKVISNLQEKFFKYHLQQKYDKYNSLRSFVSFSISGTEIKFLFFLPETLEVPELFGYT